MENTQQLRQKIINILWSHDGLSESEVYKIVNEIMKALKSE